MQSKATEKKLEDLKLEALAKLPSPQKSFEACETTDNLIDFLDKEFPEKSPSPGSTIEQIWMEVGQREVIRILLDFKTTRDLNIQDNLKNQSSTVTGA